MQHKTTKNNQLCVKWSLYVMS